MKKSIALLSTKILSPDQEQALLNTNCKITQANFIQTTNVTFTIQEIKQNLLFTSQNAVQSILENPNLEALKSRPTFCVGIKTKQLLEQNGFVVTAYTGYAADLAEIITLIYPNQSYTFFSGNLRKDTLPEALQKAQIPYNEIIVYQTQLTPHKISTPQDIILFFSPSGVNSYLQNNTIQNQTCICIGTTTAQALENITQNILVANPSTIDQVIQITISHLQQK